MMGLLGRIWCWIMEKLEEKRWCTLAWETAVVHCWFLGCMGFGSTKLAFIDLLRLPVYMVMCGSYQDRKWCLRCRRAS